MSPEKITLVEKLIAESEIIRAGDVVYSIVSVKNGIVTALEIRDDTSVVYQENIPISDLVKSPNASLYRLTHFLDLNDLA